MDRNKTGTAISFLKASRFEDVQLEFPSVHLFVGHQAGGLECSADAFPELALAALAFWAA